MFFFLVLCRKENVNAGKKTMLRNNISKYPICSKFATFLKHQNRKKTLSEQIDFISKKIIFLRIYKMALFPWQYAANFLWWSKLCALIKLANERKNSCGEVRVFLPYLS